MPSSPEVSVMALFKLAASKLLMSRRSSRYSVRSEGDPFLPRLRRLPLLPSKVAERLDAAADRSLDGALRGNIRYRKYSRYLGFRDKQ
jgi:hypothetical protein